MTRLSILPLLSFSLLLPIFSNAQQAQPGSEPLLNVAGDFHGGVDLRYQSDRRALEADSDLADSALGSSDLAPFLGDPLEVDFEQIILRCAFQAHPVLSLHVEGGWSEAEIGDQKSDGDLIWGIGGTLNLIEKALKGSAEQPKREVLRLSLEGNYRSTEGDFEDGVSLEFDEFELIPLFTYERNNDLNLDRSSYQPPGMAAHVGVVLNSVDASLGGTDLEEKDAASLLLGFDLRWASGWSTQLRAIISSDSDRRVGLGAGYNF